MRMRLQFRIASRDKKYRFFVKFAKRAAIYLPDIMKIRHYKINETFAVLSVIRIYTNII
jgi:hypothetical protein